MRSAFVPNKRKLMFFDEPSRTRQEFLDECDINVLMSRYEKRGIWPMQDPSLKRPAFFDTTLFTNDFREAMDMINEADRAFMSLPATVRRDFDNDPAQFVAFATRGDSLEKLREWGLAEPEAKPEPPMRVEVVNPAPPAPSA